MRSKILMFAMCIASTSAFADKVELDMKCDIGFEGKLYATGPCKVVVRDNTFTSIKGNNTENGVSFNLVADESQGTALLMGAGTFPLASGKVETNVDGVTYRWPNGYTFDTSTP